LKRERGLKLVVAGIASLSGIPAFLAGLEQRNGARGCVSNLVRRRSGAVYHCA